MITLTIPELCPSLNVTRRGHWSTRHKRRKHWSMLVLVAKSEAGLFVTPNFTRARVRVERHGGKLMDRDNLYASVKDLVDGLRDNGIIENDDPEHCELSVEQYPGSRIPKRTVVHIEDARRAA